MNARETITFILRVMAIIVFINMIASMRLDDRSFEYQSIYFSFIVLGVISCFLVVLSKRIARALAPTDEEAAADIAGPCTALTLQPFAFALMGLILVIKALAQIPAALVFVFSQSDMSNVIGDSVIRQLWLERTTPYLLLLMGIILIVRARHLSSLWHNYTFGRFEE